MIQHSEHPSSYLCKEMIESSRILRSWAETKVFRCLVFTDLDYTDRFLLDMKDVVL